MRTIKPSALFLIVAISALIQAVSAQQSKETAPAPVPAQIAAAQKVFISNAGGASLETVIDETVFNGGPDRPYNQFYAAMKSWGRYEVVSTPADADLVFEISWALTDTGLRSPYSDSCAWSLSIPKPASRCGTSPNMCEERCCWGTATKISIKR